MKVAHHIINVKGWNVFYREAGKGNGDTILFLHGFPSSSHMYRELMELLSEDYHVIAPDYPGFGLSDTPSPEVFEYTFDHLSEYVEDFISAIGLTEYYLFVQDYGGPVGFRIAQRNPDAIKGLIIQNANAYMEGIGEWPQKMAQFEKENDLEGLRAFQKHLLSYEGIKDQYLVGAADPNKVDPVSYGTDAALLERIGNRDIQAKLLQNYPSNFPKYEQWQRYFQDHQPKTLVVWGKNDKFFSEAGGRAYTDDLKNIDLHFFDGGHFMLEEYVPEVGELVKNFID